MVEVISYMTVIKSAGNWVNPNNLLGQEDTVCTTRTTIGGGTDEIWAAGSFNIPSEAILDSVYLKGKAFHNRGLYGGGAVALMAKTPRSGNVFYFWFGQPSGECPATYYSDEVDALWVFRGWGDDITVDELNNQRFQVGFLHTAGLAGIYRSFVDAARLRVIYHIPPPVGARGDGLVWMLGLLRQREKQIRLKPHFFSYESSRTFMARGSHEKI